MQNTRWPMVVSIVMNVTNIVISAGLVVFSGMGIEGIANGTFVAQWVGAILLMSGVYFYICY